MSGLRITCIVICLAGIAACGIASNSLSVEMVDEVNRQLPEEERFFVAFWHQGKINRLLSEHARLFPSSKLRRKRRGLIVVSAVCITMLALALFLR
jgi:hypothetical protein